MTGRGSASEAVCLNGCFPLEPMALSSLTVTKAEFIFGSFPDSWTVCCLIVLLLDCLTVSLSDCIHVCDSLAATCPAWGNPADAHLYLLVYLLPYLHPDILTYLTTYPAAACPAWAPCWLPPPAQNWPGGSSARRRRQKVRISIDGWRMVA